eukprot:763856-Hanusia_phi.AAC.4
MPVSARDMAERLAKIGLKPLNSACRDLRKELEEKWERLQGHELEAESLLILLQSICGEVSQRSIGLQKNVLKEVEELKDMLDTRAMAMVHTVREQERLKLSTLHAQIAAVEKEYESMKRSSSSLKSVLKDSSSDPLEFVQSYRNIEGRVVRVLQSAESLRYQPEESSSFLLDLNVEPQRAVIAQTNFHQLKTPPFPPSLRFVRQEQGAILLAWTEVSLPPLLDISPVTHYSLHARRISSSSSSPQGRNKNERGEEDERGQWEVVFEGQERQHLMSRAKGGERWKFRVCACNQFGMGECSSEVEVNT